LDWTSGNKGVHVTMEGPGRPPRTLVWFWGTGGAGVRFSHRVAAEIAARHGAENVALSLHEDSAWKEQISHVAADVSLIRGTSGRKSVFSMIFSILPRYLALRRQIRRFRPDVIVLTMNFAQAWPIGAAPLGAKLVYVMHDAFPHPGDYAPQMQQLTQSRLIKAADQLVTLSTYVGENARGFLPRMHRERLTVIPLAEHVERRTSQARRLGDGPVRLLFLGRLLQYKGLDILAAAVGLIADRDDWRLTIAGNGPKRDFVIEAFGRYKQVDLSRLTWLLEEEIDDLIDTHDIVVCPYSEASQSGVIAEAAGRGVPAIATPVGGLAEQTAYGRAGWVTPAATPQALAATITSILDARMMYEAKSAATLELAAEQPGKTGWGELVASVTARNAP
jgi:glycosyltransferase involved in cell wall biosynthesis